MSLDPEPQEIRAALFTALPPDLRWRGPPTAWSRGRPAQAAPIHSCLEGPAFDRDRHLW